MKGLPEFQHLLRADCRWTCLTCSALFQQLVGRTDEDRALTAQSFCPSREVGGGTGYEGRQAGWWDGGGLGGGRDHLEDRVQGGDSWARN